MATGATPILLYKELVRLHKEEGLSFSNVITVNLDEYYPIPRDAYQSYWSFMHRHLFNHIDIDPKNTHIPSGEIKKEDIKEYCRRYEKMIEDVIGFICMKAVQTVLSKDCIKPPGLTHFQKAYYNGESVLPLTAQESYKLNSFAIANCLLVLDEEKEEYKTNDSVTIHLLPV